MIFNFQNEPEVLKFRDQSEFYIKNGYTVDMTKKGNTRSDKQNRALHLLFTIVSNQLNEMGQEFKYVGLKGQELSMRHTPHLVKEMIWRPIQIALFDIKSTTKINTEQINEIVDILAKYFGEKGIVIQFPSKETLRKLIED
jgi:hypothetical protein